MDVSARYVRELLSKWNLETRRVSLDEVRVRYIRELREVAAGRAYAGDETLASARARVAAAQAEKLERQNAIARGEFAPCSLIAEVLSKAGTAAGRILDTIPGEIRRREVGVTAETLDAIAGIVAKARNTFASMKFEDLGVALDDEDATEGPPEPSDNDVTSGTKHTTLQDQDHAADHPSPDPTAR